MALKITDEQNYQDIADAIRNKLGSSDTFLPSEMADAIESIPAGGSAELKTIFIDYDGTVLHEYTQAEVDALTALPTLPSHEGLICQGWNWTLAELQAFQKPAVVGANYITDDGKTRVYISIPEGDRYVKASLSSSAAFQCTVDWGDGSTSQLTKTSKVADHTYVSGGDYVISFEVTEGTVSATGSYTTGSQLVYSGQTSGCPYGAVANIQKIELGSNFTIGSYGMCDMKNLKSISVPRICSFKEDAFSCCYSLQAFVFPREMSECGTYLFYLSYGLRIISLPPTITTIPGSLVSECNNLERVSVPDSVTEIEDFAFSKCFSLNGLIIPESIQIIRSNAFSEVGSLSDIVVLPASLTVVENQAFSNTKFEKLIINGEISFGNSVFINNRNLKEVQINSVIEIWGTSMFSGCTAIEKITVADGNAEIGESFAYRNVLLKEMILPDSLEVIPSGAFEYCYSLGEITIPSGITEIGSNAFDYCYMLKHLIIPEGVTTIASYAFSSMETLADIVFLGDIVKIERAAFSSTHGLQSIDLTNCTSVPVLENTNAFVSSNVRLKIKVPAALYDEWIAADKWSSHAAKIVAV